MIENKTIKRLIKIIAILGIFPKYRRYIRTKMLQHTTLCWNYISKIITNRNYRKILKTIYLKDKIKVGFLVSENSKWNCQSLYDELEKHPYFEPIILITRVKQLHDGYSSFYDDIEDNKKFFTKKGLRFQVAYDIQSKKYIPLKKFECDIIFYQQPWWLHSNQQILKTSYTALTAYVPYCFHMLEEENNYFEHFHKILWCYFVESKLYEKKYKEIYNATNIVYSGHTKLDNYLSNTHKKNTKPTIIYAPHHLNCDNHLFLTWEWNGKEILEFAKKNNQYHWIFKPHPHFKDSLIRNNILTLTDMDTYFEEWNKVGEICLSGDYYNLFKSSACLITDCISFLAEYMPTKSPVIFLKANEQKAPFTDLGEIITRNYYKVHTWSEFIDIFNRVIIQNDDYLKNERLNDLTYLIDTPQQSAAKKIVNYLEKLLKQPLIK